MNVQQEISALRERLRSQSIDPSLEQARRIAAAGCGADRSDWKNKGPTWSNGPLDWDNWANTQTK